MSEEDKRFQKHASSALRLHRRGAHENLLCQHLIISVASDPFMKIRLICEAAYMVDAEKLNLDLEKVDRLYSLCLSFMSTKYNPNENLVIAWNFKSTPENYAHYIQPWRKIIPIHFSYLTGNDRQNKQKALDRYKTLEGKFFCHTVNLDLRPSSFQLLKSQYLRWAIPRTMRVFEKLSRLVQPDQYKEMLGVLKGKDANVVV